MDPSFASCHACSRSGLAFFYGGLVNEGSVVNTMMLSYGCMAIVTLLWGLVGYSLCFDASTPDGVIGIVGACSEPLSLAMDTGSDEKRRRCGLMPTGPAQIDGSPLIPSPLPPPPTPHPAPQTWPPPSLASSCGSAPPLRSTPT